MSDASSILASLFDFAFLAKILLLFATSRWWLPSARAMWHELQEFLAPGGGMYGLNRPRPSATRPFHDDPFVNIPLAAYRADRKANRPERQREIVPVRRRDAPQAKASKRSSKAPRLASKRGF